MKDSLKVTQREDGSFEISWDKDDPQWSFLNNVPSEFVEQKINELVKKELDTLPE